MARRKHLATQTGEAIIPDAVDIDPDAYVVMPDGRRTQRHAFGLTDEVVERIKQGYVCIKCLEAYANAFPDKCLVCGFPMRDQQAAEFAKDFRGGVQYGPSTTIDEEYEIAEEMIQKDAYDRARKLGLILPEWY